MADRNRYGIVRQAGSLACRIRIRHAALWAAATTVLFFSGACAQLRTAQRGLNISSIQQADCTPITDLPVFHFVATTADGAVLPADNSLLSRTTLTLSTGYSKMDRQTVHPFYAGPFGADSRLRLSLILLDVSGSMAGKSFATARMAAGRFLKDFNPALDRIAVAPFGSRDVAATIAAARFSANEEDVRKAIAAIPEPRSDNNTALYSAVASGLDALAAEAARTTGDPQMMLILLTDGKNDLSPADLGRDPGLLEGVGGLEKTAAKLRTSRAQTFTIGFGRKDQVNEADLRLLGRGETRIVQSADQLDSVFLDARRVATNSVLMAFALPGAASGRDMGVTVNMDLPSGPVQGSGVWSAPQFSPGLPESPCSMPERKAALGLAPNPGGDVMRTLIVFAVIGLILALAWLALPRLIWSDSEPQYYRPAAPFGMSADDGERRARGSDDPTQAVPKSDRSRYRR